MNVSAKNLDELELDVEVGTSRTAKAGSEPRRWKRRVTQSHRTVKSPSKMNGIHMRRRKKVLM